MSISSHAKNIESWLRLSLLLLDPRHANSSGLYTLMSTNNVFSGKTLFINLGYWKNTEQYDEACYELAGILAEAAAMSKDDVVLDAGFGFAEQDIFWAKKYKPASIVGLNVTRLQVDVASRRVREIGLADRIHLLNASATKMPIADQSVTKVVALESAFHFQTRQQFFEESFRVMKPGGRIALADLLLLPGRSLPGSKRWIMNRLGCALWQIPKSNMDSIDSYASKLRSAGFTDVKIESIREHVLPPFRYYVRSRLSTPQPTDQMSRPMKFLWRLASSEMKPLGTLDYILASARRP